jgi:hypothetical protein
MEQLTLSSHGLERPLGKKPSTTASPRRYPQTPPPPQHEPQCKDPSCRKRHHRRCSDKIVPVPTGLTERQGSTTGRLLLPERGPLPLSPRIEGVDPPARKQLLGSRASGKQRHSTKESHCYQLPTYCRRTRPLTSNLKAASPRRRRRRSAAAAQAEAFGFSPEMGKSGRGEYTSKSP